MQQTHAFFLIGTVIQDRYIIEDVLSKGGSSTVYLVRDLLPATDADMASESEDQLSDLFALKVLTELDQQEKNHFMFGHVMLQWLDHPALPRVHSMFEDKNHAYMLMDYIAGPTLETLRRQQVGKHFSLEQVRSFLSPIVAAITYLHRQQPPIIHCDIKPSNIVVSREGDKAFLVDFGIAKEYDPDATITAVRQCSQGFGAPEQYSSMRTDQRTDIYGLAATCYVLLTGITPIDALRRVTSLAGKESDPLVPLDTLAPTLPVGVREAIHRALSISSNERFATIEEFWQALQDTDEIKDKEPSEALVQGGGLYDPQAVSAGQTRPAHRLQRTALMTHMALTFLLILGFGFWTYSANQLRSQPQQASSPSLSVDIQQQPTPPPSTAGTYAHLVSSYQGSIRNIPLNMSTQMYLLQVLQSGQNIQGTFKGLNRSDPFVGVLDISKHIFFTVGSAGATPLFFQGVVRADSNLAGNYCTLDSAGQCLGEYGIWSVGP